MPKPSSATSTAVATKPKPAAKNGGAKNGKRPPIKRKGEEAEKREIVYEKFEVKLHTFENGNPITAELAKKYVGWETEADYQARIGSDKPVSFGDDYLLRDMEGNKVRCRYNTHNRRYKPEWMEELKQDVLNREWAGPYNYPGETVNGDTIVITREGEVIQGNHRFIGVILAAQEYHLKHEHWSEEWGGVEPFIEGLIVTGVSDNPKIARTVDNTMPRTLADTIYTSPTFADLDSDKKNEASKMMASAAQLLWERVGQGEDEWEGKQTHSAAHDFINRHPKLEIMVRHLFEENQGRRISRLHLQPGQCAAACYLMAASDTDGDVYRNQRPLAESGVDFKHWDKATEFFVLLGAGPDFDPVVKVLSEIVDVDNLAGRMTEKLSVLAAAWGLFKKNKPITEDAIRPETAEDFRTKKHVIVNWHDFDGIDLGHHPEPPEKELTPEEVEANAKAEKEAKDKAKRGGKAPGEVTAPKTEYDEEGKPPAPKLLKKPLHKRDDATPAPNSSASTILKDYEDLRSQHPGKTMLVKTPRGLCAWGSEAKAIGAMLKIKTETDGDGLIRLAIPTKQTASSLLQLKKSGKEVAIARSEGDQVVVEDYVNGGAAKAGNNTNQR